MSLRSFVHNRKDALRLAARDLSSPAQRRRALLHFYLFDHGFIRSIWTNLSEIAPGVFRANHPSPRRLHRYAKRGIKTILNLRGASDIPHYLLEKETCAHLGLGLIDLPRLKAAKAPPKDALLDAIAAMRTAQKPFLMHCKSGADRTSLMAAIYLLVFEGVPLKVARKQMSPRFIHFKWTKTGVLDKILETYGRDTATSQIGFEDWVRTRYDAKEIQASFNRTRA